MYMAVDASYDKLLAPAETVCSMSSSGVPAVQEIFNEAGELLAKIPRPSSPPKLNLMGIALQLLFC